MEPITKNNITVEEYLKVEDALASSITNAIAFLKKVSESPIYDIEKLYFELKSQTSRNPDTSVIALRRCIYVVCQLHKKQIEIPEYFFDNFSSFRTFESKTRKLLKPSVKKSQINNSFQEKSSKTSKKSVIHVEDNTVANEHNEKTINNTKDLVNKKKEEHERLLKLLKTLQNFELDILKVKIDDMNVAETEAVINAMLRLLKYE